MAAAPINQAALAAERKRRTRYSLWRLTGDEGDKVASWLEDLDPDSLEYIPGFASNRQQQDEQQQIHGHRHNRTNSSTASLALRNAMAPLTNSPSGVEAFAKASSHNRTDSLPRSDRSSTISMYSDDILPGRSISRVGFRGHDERFYAHAKQQSLSDEGEQDTRSRERSLASDLTVTTDASMPSLVLTSTDVGNLSSAGSSNGRKTPELCDDTSEITIEDLLEQCRTNWRKSLYVDAQRPPTPPPKSPNLVVRGPRRKRYQAIPAASMHSKSHSESSNSDKSFMTAAEPSPSFNRPYPPEPSPTAARPHPYRFRSASSTAARACDYLTPPASPLVLAPASPAWSLFSTNVFIDEDFERSSSLSIGITRELENRAGFRDILQAFPEPAPAPSSKQAPANQRALPPSAPPPSAPLPSAPLPSAPSGLPLTRREPLSAPASSPVFSIPGTWVDAKSPQQSKKQQLPSTKSLKDLRRVKIRQAKENVHIFRAAAGKKDRPSSAQSSSCCGDEQEDMEHILPGTPKLSPAQIEDYLNTVHISPPGITPLSDLLPLDHDDDKPAPVFCVLPLQKLGRNPSEVSVHPTTPLGNLINLFPALPTRHSADSSFLPLAGGRRR